MYYKLAAADLPDLAARIRALQADACAGATCTARLQSRVDAPGAVVTVMEVYANIADPSAFGARLKGALARSGLPPALLAARRCERFADL